MQPIILGAALLESGRGGIARVARMTAKTLLAAGYDLVMVSLLDKPISIESRRVWTARGSKVAFAARCQVEALRQCRFIYNSVGIARAHPRLRPFRRPYAVWMHGVEVWYGMQPATQNRLRSAELRIANSNFTLDKYRRMHDSQLDAEVCWLATEEDSRPPRRPEFGGPPTVMILARIDKNEGYKGHLELLAAWPDVVSAIPDARLLIAGAGSGLADLKDTARLSPVSNHIEFTGFVEEADLPNFWQRAHLFAMPSRNEGFGLVYVEAMRYGLPVIASIHDAGQEVNVHGVTGLNVNLDKQNELADSIIALLREPDQLQRMGLAGQERWSENFCQSAFERRLRPILNKFAQ